MEDNGVSKAAKNLPGVDVAILRNLNAELLAPGANPGRLVVWAKSAFNALDETWEG
jgi:large subunit ribosomal protein L4e